MADFGAFFGQLAVAWAIIANTWWFWMPILLGYAGFGLWKYYLKVRYFANLPWTVLEVRIPREIAKTPEAMEQVFSGLQAMYWAFDPYEMYWEGLQHDYLSFEMASIEGETRFYVRLPSFYRNLVEAQVYAQYPEAEIVEIEDYLGQLPAKIPSADWSLFGLEFKLEKPDPYPIRTYRDILSLTSATEEFAKVDPLSSMVEAMGRCGPGEHVGYHLLIRPAQSDKWKKDGEALIMKLTGRKPPEKKSGFAEALKPLGQGWGDLLREAFGYGAAAPAAPAKKEEPRPMAFLPPDIDEQVKAIVRNLAKPGFETIVRFCYAARRDVFSMSHLNTFISALKTYNTQTLNGFKLNSKAMATKTAWWLPSRVTRGRKAYKMGLYWRYYLARKPFTDTRALKSQLIVLNAEELATIYHYPGRTAKAPLLPRIEAKRSEPPATLPVG